MTSRTRHVEQAEARSSGSSWIGPDVDPCAPAARDAPCRVLHWSDPHFGTERPAVMRALIQLAGQAAPTLQVLSGDITQRARASQFRAARDFIDAMQQRSGAPCLALAGNHDVPLFNLLARACWPLRQYRRWISPVLEPVYVDAHLLVLFVHTVRRWRHEDGEVSARQVARVAQRLRQAAPGQLRLVVTHQPVCVNAPDERHNLLIGHAEAVRQWAAAGADLVLGGHIHLAYAQALADTPAGVLRQLWALQAGTALSTRVRREQPNSVNLLGYWPAAAETGLNTHTDIGAASARVVVEQWDFSGPSDPATDGAGGRFQCVRRQMLGARP